MCHILRKSLIVILVSFLVASIVCPFAVGNSYHPASAASSVSPDGWGVVDNRPASHWVYGIWGSSSSDVFAVGESGTIVHFDGYTWNPMTSGALYLLSDVWGSSGSDVWAVGQFGAIFHYDGNSWSDWSLPGPSAPDLWGVWGTSSTDVFFAGRDGNILHYTNGSTWDWRTVGTDDLFDVWGNSGSDVYVVGENGTILHYDGNPDGIWTTISSGTSVALMGLWGSSSPDIFAVGQYGTIVHYSPITGISVGSYGSDLHSVWGSSLYDIYAAGSDGTILHYNGSIWSPMNSGTAYRLYGVWGYYPDYDVYVVGMEGFTYTGIILHYPSPTISTVSPDHGTRGQTMEVSIKGAHLDSVNDIGDVSFGSGITVNSLPFQSSTEIRANITISPGATLGLRDVSVSDSGDTYTMASAFEVVAPPAPTVSSVNPSQGAQGQTLGVTISGTNLSGATAVSFGNGITVNAFNPDSPTQITANISIGGGAALGSRNVSVTAGGSTGTMTGGFTVVATAPSDTNPPADIANLAASGATTTSVTLTWTAPGDDGNTGTASSYDIRYSAAAITNANWGSASQCSGEPAPQAAGADQTFTVTGLSPDTTYYFAIKTADEMPNWSGLSNMPSRKTEAVLPNNHPPSRPAGLSPVTWSSGVSLTPTLQASTFSDPDSGDHHVASQWHIDDDPWDFTSLAFDSGTDATNLTSVSVPSGKLAYSTLYYWRVRYEDSQGAWSDWSVEMCFVTTSATTDSTPPTTPIVSDDGASTTSTTSLHATWSSSDPESVIVEYQYAIGTFAGTDDVLEWTSVGMATGTTATGLSLKPGRTYYVSVKARNNQGLWSEIGSSNGITVSADGAEPEPGDGGGLPFWVWILVALGVVGVGAGGFLFWRKRKARAT
jgi:hypothetical protein